MNLSKYAMVSTTLTGIAAEIIQTGQRSGFDVSNLDNFRASLERELLRDH